MKKKKLFYGLTMFVGLSATFAFAESASAADMHRLYNPNSGEHFYTANSSEKKNLVKVGWKSEGIGWTAPSSGTPVYRLYNPNAGDHHYTLNVGERDHLKKVGWRYEGIGWYSDTKKAVPLYRAYNPNAKAGSHNYTTNYAEQKNLLKVGWRNEGIAWYGVKKTSTPTPVQKYTIKVEHRGSDGKVLKSSSTSVEKGKKYTANSASFSGYTLKGNKSQTITVSKNQTITFNYTKNTTPAPTKYTVTILHKGSDKELKKTTSSVEKGTKYTAKAENFNGYTLQGNNSQTITVNSNSTITFKYLKNSGASKEEKKELQALYDRVKNTQKGNYTDETWNEFQKQLNTTKTVLDSDSVNMSTVMYMQVKLQEAFDNLEEKAPVQKFNVVVIHKSTDNTILETEPTKSIEKGKAFTANSKNFKDYQLQGKSTQTIIVNANATITFTYKKVEEENLNTIANQIALDALNIINQFRQSEHPNLRILKHNSSLQTATNVRAKEILQYFEHTRPDGGTYDEAVYEAGYQGFSTGENIGKFTSYSLEDIKNNGARQLVEAWKRSSQGHREFLLSGESNEAAVGVHIINNGGNYTVGFTFIGGDDGYSPQSGHKIHMTGYDEGGKALYQRTIRTLNDTYTPQPEQSILNQGYIAKSGFTQINLPTGSDGRKSIEVKLVYKKK